MEIEKYLVILAEDEDRNAGKDHAEGRDLCVSTPMSILSPPTTRRSPNLLRIIKLLWIDTIAPLVEGEAYSTATHLLLSL